MCLLTNIEFLCDFCSNKNVRQRVKPIDEDNLNQSALVEMNQSTHRALWGLLSYFQENYLGYVIAKPRHPEGKYCLASAPNIPEAGKMLL